MSKRWVTIPYDTDFHAGTMGYFADGYFLGAKSLANKLLATTYVNCEAFPVIFLYRMSLELYLKNTIYLGSKRLQQENNLINSHSFESIIPKFEKIFLKILPYEKDLLNDIKSACDFFNTNDPESFSYRYPIDKKGDPITKGQTVDLYGLTKSLNPILEKLNTIHFGLSNDLAL